MSAASLLREYGEAIRGDWSDIDGRTVRSDLESVAAWMEVPESFPGDEAGRIELGICVAGAGHWCGTWFGYCASLACGCPEDGSAA